MGDEGTASRERVTDYDSIADRFDARYGLYGYDGVRETVFNFVSEAALAVLEVGCGTGHWLAALETRLEASAHASDAGRATASAGRRLLAAIDPSAPMLARAKAAAPGGHLVRALAEHLPWRDATFDRVFCVNALHHFADRAQFFAEARRVLRPAGGFLTIGKDPHTEHDSWWVYDYFEETREIDRARFARVRTLRGELTQAGFSWSESFEADRIEALYAASEALEAGPDGPVARSFTSQLTVLSDDEFNRGVERIRAANAAAGNQLQLVADFRLYATVGWLT
jgi:ubiquinone/menaquinone biosynthesis C-methylase UbiE